MKVTPRINSWELTKDIASCIPHTDKDALYAALSMMENKNPVKHVLVQMCDKIKQLSVKPEKTCEKTSMVTLSTAHINESTAKWLYDEIEICSSGLSVYEKKNVGFFIYIPDNFMEANQEACVPADLIDCIKFTIDNDSTVLCLDADGPIEYGKLKTFEW